MHRAFRPFRLPVSRRVVLAMSALHTLTSGLHAASPPIEEWAAIWNGPGNHDDVGAHVVIDGDAIYVSGSTYEPGLDGSREDFILLRYDLDGTLQWTRRYGGAGLDDPSAMLLAAPGMVVMTGFVWDASPRIRTLAHDADGTLLWDESLPVTGDAHPFLPPALTQDSDGNLLVAGHSDGDYLVAKYTLDGTLLWTETYDAPGEGIDAALSVATDAANAVYVSGRINWAQGYATIKLDADGVFQWEQFEDGDIGSTFEFIAVDVGPDGNPVVVGNPESVCGVFETRVWKCDAATGDTLWVRSYPPDPCNSIEPVDMTIDADGNVLVTGFGNVGSPAETHFQTLRYGPDGELHWIREFDGSGSSTDIAAALTVDTDGNVYVTGHTTHPPQDRDFATVAYAPDGTERWRMEWAGPWGTNDGAFDVAVSDAGDVVVSGHAYNPDQQQEAITIRYRQSLTVGVTEAVVSVRPRLLAAPNPSRGGTTFRHHARAPGRVQVTIHDVAGRRVARLSDVVHAAGIHRLHWDGTDDRGRALPAGVYVVRLTSGGERSTARIELLD